MALDFEAIAFWGFAFGQTYAPPWKDSADPEPRDGRRWEERWQRRRGHANDMSCMVGVHLHLELPMYFVTVTESIREGAYNRAKPVRDFEVGERWHGQLQDFCQAMDIPWEEPGWCLVTYMF